MRKRDRIVTLVAVVLIAYGAGTMSGLMHWPGQGARKASASTFAFSMPCSAVSAATSAASTPTGATRVAVDARAAGCSSPLYQFWILPPGAAGYQIVQAYSRRSTFVWIPVGVAPGTYRFVVWARDAGSDGLSVNSLGRLDVFGNAGRYTVNQCSTLAITVSKSSFTKARATTVNVRAAARGCSHPLYRFWLLAPGATTYQMIQDYSSNPTLTRTITGLRAGTYRISVWVRDRASSGVIANSFGRCDAFSTAAYQVA